MVIVLFGGSTLNSGILGKVPFFFSALLLHYKCFIKATCWIELELSVYAV